MKSLALLVVLVFIVGCAPEPEKPREIVKKNIAWCESVCMKDMFSNLHSKGESWGTDSSSMSGFGQGDTFNTIKDYCTEIYIDGCYSVEYSDPAVIHSDHYDGRRSTNTLNP